jgi:hypothetical protein
MGPSLPNALTLVHVVELMESLKESGGLGFVKDVRGPDLKTERASKKGEGRGARPVETRAQGQKAYIS